MQTNTQNIQRPALFSDFFGEEIDYKNDFVTYIYVSSNDENIVHKGSATSLLNNIKNSLKSAKNRHSALVRVGLEIKKIHSDLRTSELSGSRDTEKRTALRDLNKLRNHISIYTA